MTTRELIAAAIKTDKFVFDVDAEQHNFSYRLIHLLVAVGSDSLMPDDPPVKLLVPSWVRVEVPYGCATLVGGSLWGLPVDEMSTDATAEYERQGG